MDAYVRRYADGDFFSGVVRVTKGDRVIYENAFGVHGSGLAGSQFAANQVSDRVAVEADDSGGDFVIGGGGEALVWRINYRSLCRIFLMGTRSRLKSC